MKVIFLDFDGCLNSVQECVQKRNRMKHSFYWRTRERFANFLCGFTSTTDKNGCYKSKKDTGLFKYRRWLCDFGRQYVSDHAEFCPIACSNVQYLLDSDKDVRIVVSSTWRSSGIKRLKQILKRNGIDPNKLIDVTPYGQMALN